MSRIQSQNNRNNQSNRQAISAASWCLNAVARFDAAERVGDRREHSFPASIFVDYESVPVDL